MDEYGFSISRTLAKEIADDWFRLEYLERGDGDRDARKDVPEASQIYARQAERDQFLQCPPGYSAEQDLKRRDDLLGKRRNGLSLAERTEIAFVIARITASDAAYNQTPEGRARRRVKELHARRRMRHKPPHQTPEEEKELEQLHKDVPSLGAYKSYWMDRYLAEEGRLK